MSEVQVSSETSFASIEAATPMESQTQTDHAGNENTEIDGTLELSGGSSAVSFDELEAIHKNHDNKVKAEAKALKKEAQKKDAAKEDKPTEEKAAEAKEDSKAEEPKEESDKEAKESEEVSEEEGKDSATEDTGKTYRAKTKSGREVELATDTKFVQRVDGVDQEVSLEEALNSWSGHKAVDRRFSELNQEKQKLVDERRVVDDTIRDITTQAGEGNYQGALISFFEKALGVDPVTAITSLREGFRAEFEKTTGMSEHELLAHNAQYEAGLLKTQNERRITAQQAEAQRQELNSRIDKVIQSNGLEVDTYEAVAEELLELKKLGKVTKEITPEFIAEVAVYDKNSNTAKQILGDLNTAYAADTQQIDYLANLLGNGASVEDVRALATQKFGTGSSATNDLAKKLSKTQNTQTTTASKPAIDPQNTDVFSFDQL